MVDDGYTIVPDILVKEFGYLTALVYGVVYRYSQFTRGRCDASLSTIGEKIGISRKAVNDHIKKLCDAGYLQKEVTENGTTNKYYVTDKLSQGYKPVTESNRLEDEKQEEPVTESYTPVTEGYTPLSPKVTPPVTEGYTKSSNKTSTKTSKKDSGKKPAQKKPDVIPAFKVYVDVTGQYYLSKPQQKIIGDAVGADPPALEKWRAVITAWVGKGYNPRNVTGMLDWFRGGIPQYKNGGTNGHINGKAGGTGATARRQRLDEKPYFDPFTNGGEYVYPDGRRVPAAEWTG